MITYKSSIIYFPSKKEDQCCDNYYFNSKVCSFENDGARVRLSQKSAKNGRQVFGICSGNYESFMDKSPVYAAFDKLKKYHSFYIKKEDTNVEKLLKNYFREATVDVAASTEGTVALPKVSMAVVTLDGENVTVANAGNVKVFRVKDGTASEISTEHTQARRMADMGIIPEQKLKAHPQRKRLTRYLGGGADAATPSVVSLKAEGDETFIILSSAFFDFAEKETLADSVNSASEPADIAAYIMSAYLNEEVGDYTAIVIKSYACEDIPEETTENTADEESEKEMPVIPAVFREEKKDNEQTENVSQSENTDNKSFYEATEKTNDNFDERDDVKIFEFSGALKNAEKNIENSAENTAGNITGNIVEEPKSKVSVVITENESVSPFEEEIPEFSIDKTENIFEENTDALRDKKADGNMMFDWSEVETETSSAVVASRNAVELNDDNSKTPIENEKTTVKTGAEALGVKIEEIDNTESNDNNESEPEQKGGIKEAVKRFIGSDSNENEEDDGKTLWPTVIIFALSLLIVILLLFLGIKMIGKNKNENNDNTPAPTAEVTLAPTETEKPSVATETPFETPSEPTETPSDATTEPGETEKPTNAPTNKPTNAPTKAPTNKPTNAPTPTPTATSEPTDTSEPTGTSDPTDTSEPTGTAEPTDTSEPTGTAEPTDTSEPTGTAEPTDTSEPTDTAVPTATPEPTDTAEPTATPEPEEPSEPTAEPEENPTV